MFAGLSAKVSLFLYVRSRAQIEYYLNIADARRAANESLWVRSEPESAEPRNDGAKIIEMRSASRRSRS
jgi:hypothetical protein